MNKIIIGVIGVLALLGVILGASALVGNQPAAPQLGRVGSEFPNGLAVGTSTPALTQGQFVIGTSGTPVVGLNTGSCTLYQYVNTIAATSSITTDCVNTTSAGIGTQGGLVALTGIQSGDKVFMTFASSTAPATALGNIAVVSAIASTTSGYIRVVLSNLSGATFTYPITASTTLYYLAWR